MLNTSTLNKLSISSPRQYPKTQTHIRFFYSETQNFDNCTAIHFFYSKIKSFKNCTQTSILFFLKAKWKIIKTAPNRVVTTKHKIWRLYPNGHRLSYKGHKIFNTVSKPLSAFLQWEHKILRTVSQPLFLFLLPNWTIYY